MKYKKVRDKFKTREDNWW